MTDRESVTAMKRNYLRGMTGLFCSCTVGWFCMASQSVTRIIPPCIFLSSAADVSAYGNTVTLNPGEMWERHTRLVFFKYLMFEIEVHSGFQSCYNFDLWMIRAGCYTLRLRWIQYQSKKMKFKIIPGFWSWES